MSETEQTQKKNLLSRMGSALSNKGKSVVGYESIRQGWDEISENAKILNPFRKKKRRRPEETFDQAYARNKLSETALARIYRNQMIAFYVSVAFAVICALLAVSFFLSKGLLSALSALGPMFVCLSLSVSSSFKMMKIRKRNLGIPFDEWKSSPKEWVPGRFEMLRKQR